MQRTLPECVRSCLGLCLLTMCGWSCAGLMPGRCSELGAGYDPFEAPATLGTDVAGPDLLWQSTIKGYLSDSTGLPRTTARKAPAKPVVEQPVVIADKPPVTDQPVVTKEVGPEKPATTPSPFRKWITPRAGSTVSPAVPADRTGSAAAPLVAPDRTPDGPALTPPVQEDSVPEVARRTMPQRTYNRTRTSQTAQPQNASQNQRQVKPAPQTTGNTSKSEQEATPLELAPITPAAPESQQGETELPPLNRNQQAMRSLVRRVLNYYYDHPMNTRDRSPWEVMHVALSYESKSRLLVGGPTGKPVSAAGWLCYNQPCRNMRLMYVDDEGELQVRSAPAFQGHEGQLLAMLAQAKISSDYPMLVDGRDLTVKDLIRAEMRTCYPRTELTFKLIGLMYYLDSETTWVNDQGQDWSIRKLITEEMRQPIRGATCGGSHRLSGLTLAYKTREARGEPMDGEFLAAQRFVAQYQQQAFRLQNPDGSFSTNWFQGKENRDDLDRQLRTTGHVLEWLLYSATDRELNSPRTTKAVYFLANLLWTNRYRDWDSGILGHSLHSLVLYDRLKFSMYDAPGEDTPVAVRNTSPGGRRSSR